MGESKGALRSLSIWGSLGSIGTVLALITQLREFIEANPELIDESRLWLLAAGALLSQLVSIIGRLRAKARIRGIV